MFIKIIQKFHHLYLNSFIHFYFKKKINKNLNKVPFKEIKIKKDKMYKKRISLKNEVKDFFDEEEEYQEKKIF